jgi:hypothetical protein
LFGRLNKWNNSTDVTCFGCQGSRIWVHIYQGHLPCLYNHNILIYLRKWLTTWTFCQRSIISVQFMSEWVSEWLLFNANSAIFQLYRGENKLIFNEMMMISVLY